MPDQTASRRAKTQAPLRAASETWTITRAGSTRLRMLTETTNTVQGSQRIGGLAWGGAAASSVEVADVTLRLPSSAHPPPKAARNRSRRSGAVMLPPDAH